MIHIDEINIYEISYSKLKDMIIARKNNKEVERLLFLAKHKSGSYFALDNENNCFFLEEFDSRRQAICWLVRCDINAENILFIKDEDIKVLLKDHKYKIKKYEVK